MLVSTKKQASTCVSWITVMCLNKWCDVIARVCTDEPQDELFVYRNKGDSFVYVFQVSEAD